MSSDSSDIVVVGHRLRAEHWDDGSGVGGYSSWVPSAFTRLDFEGGAGGGGSQIDYVSLAAFSDMKQIKVPGCPLPVQVPTAEWALLSAHQQAMMLKVFERIMFDPDMAVAMNHLVSEEVAGLVFHIGSQWEDTYGRLYDYQSENGFEPLMVTQYNGVSGPYDTDLKANQRIVVSINVDEINEESVSDHGFIRALLHEILHPVTPNTSPNAIGTDHPEVERKSEAAFQRMFGSNASYGEIGRVIGGTYTHDVITGGIGDDAFAGMEGNDHLSGGGGTNALFGGVGQDTLVSSGVGDLLSGGMDADRYVIEATSLFSFVKEQGGVDRLELVGSINDHSFSRYNDDLLVVGAGERVVTIQEYYLRGERQVEIFSFAEGDFSASYIETLVPGSPPPSDDPCFQNGQWVLDCNYVPPIAIDLDGDGIEIINAAESRVAFDVNGDGYKDRLSWIGPDDAILVYDRNGDGRVSGVSEFSFINDLRGARSDLEGMLGHDADRDGFITAADPIYSQLSLWIDRNSDGVSQPGELTSLKAFGITSIGLEIEDKVRLDPGMAESQVLGRSTVSAGGVAYASYDLALLFERGESCGCQGVSYNDTAYGQSIDLSNGFIL